ncbi:hypothetical protein IFO70_24220 [Phormidium tenue FACHB-886]|nr:hypothetical protein [Phormidium tenue FACHB-886]
MKFTEILARITLLSIISLGSIAIIANPSVGQQIKQNTTQGVTGEVNPALPVQIKVLNETSVELSLGSPGNTTHTIDPNSSFSTKISKLPINLFVYIQTAQPDLGLNYDISVDGNQVTVQVQQVNDDTPGDGAITIRQDGTVYVY